jgi:ComF family protein
MNSNISHLKQFLLHLIFPERCPFCDSIIFRPYHQDQYTLCQSCRQKYAKTVYPIQEPICKKCGKPLSNERQEYCFDCLKKAHCFIEGRALYRYQDPIRQSLYRFKYSGRPEYAHYYAQELFNLQQSWLNNCRLDAIVPIPLHNKRKNRRGYNQAELIAKDLSGYLNVPLLTKFLTRAKNTKPQKELSESERKNNMKGAFKITKNKVQLDNVLLVDDIYTTGSTMDSAAVTLQMAGVKRIYIINICIGNGH